ncbi:MAG TPA: hypothetical protein VNF74_02925 [Terriglobales bacterium]|nr:hypothetical protein [Terriglobales bacterium]
MANRDLELLTEVVAAACQAWHSRPPPRWARLQWTPVGEGGAAVASEPQVLRRQILECLDELEARSARRRQVGTIALRTWQDQDAVRLEVRGDSGLARVWRLASPPPATGPARRRRRRLVLPAQPQWPHARTDTRTALCVVSQNPSTVEWARSLLLPLGLGGLWATHSMQRARPWLACHPRCPLLVVENAGPSRATLILANPGTGQSEQLRLPCRSAELLAAARKICRQYEENIGKGRGGIGCTQVSRLFS